MKIDEKYKRLIKLFFSMIMVLLITVLYHQFISFLSSRNVDDGRNLCGIVSIFHEYLWWLQNWVFEKMEFNLFANFVVGMYGFIHIFSIICFG